MKIVKYISGLIFLVMIFSCNSKDGNPNTNNMNAATYFKTQSEAVLKGKNDLLSIMKSAGNFQFTVDPELLKKAQPGITVKHIELDFDQLLGERTLNTLSQLQGSPKSNINTLVVENNVVTVVQTVKSEKGWRVTGLADAALANDLDEVVNAQSNPAVSDIILYEIANLQAFVFMVKTIDRERYFTKYNGFNLKEGISIEQLYPMLHDDAQTFERKFGEEIKLKKLTK